jgi:spore coat protein U-like protein
MRTIVLTAFLVLLAFAAAPHARAAGSCTAVSVNSVTLSGFDSIAGIAPTAVATVTYTCKTNGSNDVFFTLNAGNGAFTQRYMQATLGGGTQHLNYQAYLDASHTQVFGDGTSGTCVKHVTNATNTGSFSIFLIDNASQDPYQDTESTASSYQDTLTVTWSSSSTATCQV